MKEGNCTKKQCTKCKRILDCSEFPKRNLSKDGLDYWCKECKYRHNKEWRMDLKRKTMIAFGGRCVHVDENGFQCIKNVDNNLDKLTLSHPNGDGDEHRDLISSGNGGIQFYKALRDRGWDTNGFVVQVMCKVHHLSLDNTGKKNPSYGKHSSGGFRKKGKFNDSAWLKKKYAVMSLKDIAIECGVSEGTILDRMIKFNIQRQKPGGRPGKLNPRYKEGKFNDPVWLKKKYETMTLQEIADLCGVGYTLIRRRMIKFDYPRRKSGRRC